MGDMRLSALADQEVRKGAEVGVRNYRPTTPPPFRGWGCGWAARSWWNVVGVILALAVLLFLAAIIAGLI